MRSVGMTKDVLSPREVADLVPLMRTDDVVRGFWTPDEGRANPVDVTMSMAKGARQRGAQILENTEVTDFVLDHGRVIGVRTERGDIECEKVVIAAGLWGREVAAKAGVTVPLQAAEHYYLLTEPITGVTPESVPVIEDGEAYGYYREEGGGLLVGMFEPVAKAWALDGTPRESAFAVLPPDWERMAPFLEVAMQRFPALEDAVIRTLFCGPESFTDDLSPMLGESPEVDGLYLACGLNSVGIPLCQPPHGAGDREEDRKHFHGKTERLVDQARIKVHVRIEIPRNEVVLVERDPFEFEGHVQEGIFSGDAEHFVGCLLDDARARIIRLVDAVPESHQAAFALFHALHEGGNMLHIPDLGEHSEHGFVRAPVEGSV
jgi:hypothetical protein